MRTDLKAKSIRAHQFTVGDRPVLNSKNQSSLIRDAAGNANLAVRRIWLTIAPDVVLATNRFLTQFLSASALGKKLLQVKMSAICYLKTPSITSCTLLELDYPIITITALVRARPCRWSPARRYGSGHSNAAPDKVDALFTGTMPTRWRGLGRQRTGAALPTDRGDTYQADFSLP